MAIAGLELYAERPSPIHRWTPRLKLVSFGALMFAFAAVQQLPLLLPMVATTALIYGTSQLPLRFLLSRLRYPGLFIVAMVAVLPFASGETVVAQWGGLSLYQEGLASTALVMGRFLSILTIGFVLLGTTPFLTLIRAMRTLGLPGILADMTLLSYRYLYGVADTLATMQQSMALRGYGQRRAWLRLDVAAVGQLAALVGTLLIRSYERSERIYKAMRLRGYGYKAMAAEHVPAADGKSWALTVITLVVAVGFVVAEIGL